LLLYQALVVFAVGLQRMTIRTQSLKVLLSVGVAFNPLLSVRPKRDNVVDFEAGWKELFAEVALPALTCGDKPLGHLRQVLPAHFCAFVVFKFWLSCWD
jgi:hypothetical protein